MGRSRHRSTVSMSSVRSRAALVRCDRGTCHMRGMQLPVRRLQVAAKISYTGDGVVAGIQETADRPRVSDPDVKVNVPVPATVAIAYRWKSRSSSHVRHVNW